MSWIAILLLVGMEPPFFLPPIPPAPNQTPLPPPSAEKLEAARKIARSTTLAAMIPRMARTEVDSLLAVNPDLTADEQARLRVIGERAGEDLLNRFIEAEAYAHAVRLSLEDLEAIAAFAVTPAAKNLRNAMPFINRDAASRVGSDDLAGPMRTAFCAETGKLCP